MSAIRGEKNEGTMTATNDRGVTPKGELVWIAGGEFTMGSDRHYPEERPARRVLVDGFWIDRYQVTNDDFADFVADTGYITVAERPPDAADYPGAIPELLVAASMVFVNPARKVDLRNHYNWWAWVPGADWRHPQGADSAIEDKGDHPVVHVAWDDVVAYAAWGDKELPTEAEWEFASRGGLDGAEYAWGDELNPDDRWMANTWQGDFPVVNEGLDGFEGTAPVGSFPANGYGLFDMTGNVWEWTADWYQVMREPKASCCVPRNPRGGEVAQSHDPDMADIPIPRKVIKGGSHLCAPNYCRRYRPAARMAQAVDTSTSHLGFRLISRA
jgi:formylglycine-generating enzyme required for sulfatase activity